MKTILFITIFLISTCCKAQTWDEWFRQRKTQIRYLEEQIIALQVYSNAVKDGYKMVKGGLSAIHNAKDGDFHLHHNYFNSLKNVNPSVSNYSTISSIINMQLQILQLNTAVSKTLNSNSIQENERKYIKAVMKSILQKCADNITDLTNVTTDGQLEMKDNERIAQIDAIYEYMKDKYLFTINLKKQASLLSLSRQKEWNNAQTLQSLMNLK